MKHKHYDMIIAWADGATIQFLCGDKWVDVNKNSPTWSPTETYRVKPPREFPPSSLTIDQLLAIWAKPPRCASGLKVVADEAVKQYILDCEQKNET